jgi:hypothetical protein
MSRTAPYEPRRNPSGLLDHPGRLRFIQYLWVLAFVILALVGGNEVLKASRSPGDVIRHELAAAAAELASPAGPYPTEAGRRAILRHFRAHPAALETDHWPEVSVSLLHLDRATCIDASLVARRIEGLVVVELMRYRSAADCGDDNDMTWLILP